MYTKRILIFLLCASMGLTTLAQAPDKISAADAHSLALFNAGQWKSLLAYGREQLSSGIDFPVLRMRTGYAAFMLGNYSQSLLQYQRVWTKDKTNYLALYYVYLNNLYLNNTSAARYYAGKLPAETKVQEKVEKFRIASVETEYSYKMPDDSMRNNAHYLRVGINTQLGYHLELQQSGALYNQLISEPAYTGIVVNPMHIDIQQREYYGKLTYAASGKISVLGGFHYVYTPFNSLKYDNTIAFAGINWSTPFVQLKAVAHFANITNKSFRQYDAGLTWYPMGNLKLYSITKGTFGDNLTATEVIGASLTKKIWVEGNVTIGSYDNRLDNDALYVYNDIDQKKFRAGGSLYTSLGKHLQASLNYTFDSKVRYKPYLATLAAQPDITFYQHSITGGLTWKF